MRVLFGTDGSEDASRARSLLERVPFGGDAAVCVLTVIPEPPFVTGMHPQSSSAWELLEGINQEEEPAARQLLEGEAQALRARGLAVESELRRGDPATRIVEVAREWQAELIVLGSRGLTGVEAFALGSVSRTVAHEAPCPVLLARGQHPAIARVLLATDATAVAESAVRFLERLPLATKAPIDVVHVVRPYRPFLGLVPAPHADLERAVREVRAALRESARMLVEGTARLVEAGGKPARPIVLEGEPAEQLLQYAGEQDVDLIVLGRHGKRTLREIFIGTVADRILKHAHCSVLIIPPGESAA